MKEYDEKTLTDHLYIVKKEDEKVVMCDCGFSFGDYRKNWKENARIYIRDTEEKLKEIYPAFMHCDPDWMEIREYYCPSCFTLLEVEATPPGYPTIFEFLPDIDSLKEWVYSEGE
jgi:acetone carboxylase gamma subunit